MKLSRRSAIRITLLAVPLLILFAFILFLREGITIDSFTLAGIKVQKLYLKLDNRLILQARRLEIPVQKGGWDPEQLPLSLERLHWTLRLFRSVELQEVDFTDNRLHVLYKDRILYIKSRHYEVAGMVYDRGEGMEIQIPLLRLPDYESTLSGELRYRYRDGRIEAEGFYQVPDLSGNFRFTRERDRVRFRVDSMKTGSLKKLVALMNMSREANEWLMHRLEARSYRLEYLEGEGRLDLSNRRFEPELKSMHGAMILEGVRIRFHDDLQPLQARSARVVFEEGNLFFLLKSPRYGKHSLKGSSAALLSLDDPGKLTLLLRLHYRGRVDWQVLRILHVYGLKIKLGQRSGRVDARVDLDIPLGTGKVRIRGLADFDRSTLEYDGVLLRIGGGELAFNSRKLEIRSLKIEEPWFRGVIGGSLDLEARRGSLQGKVSDLQWGEKGALVVMKEIRIPVRLGWGEKRWEMNLPSLKGSLRWEPTTGVRLFIQDLGLWRPYLRGMLSLPEGGSIRIHSPDGKRFDISGELLWKESFLYTAEGPVTQLPFQARIVGKNLELSALDGRVRYRSRIRTLKIYHLNIDAKRLMALSPRILHKEKSKKESVAAFKVQAEKSIIRYGRYVLLTDQYTLRMLGDHLRFEGVLGSDRVVLEKKGANLRVDAPDIGDRMLHSLIHFNGLQGGRYSIHVQGNEGTGYKGEIGIRGGVLKDFKAMNDMMALFNTVPALVAFSDPGFSTKGYELVEGKILFTLKGDQLSFDSILLRGRSSSIVGKGSVDLSSGELKVELGIQTAREVGKTLGKIPLVGYILFGKDKSLTAGVRIDGTLESPKVHTNPVGEALLYPLELLKRTLTAPANLMEESKPKKSPVKVAPIERPGVAPKPAPVMEKKNTGVTSQPKEMF